MRSSNCRASLNVHECIIHRIAYVILVQEHDRRIVERMLEQFLRIYDINLITFFTITEDEDEDERCIWCGRIHPDESPVSRLHCTCKYFSGIQEFLHLIPRRTVHFGNHISCFFEYAFMGTRELHTSSAVRSYDISIISGAVCMSLLFSYMISSRFRRSWITCMSSNIISKAESLDSRDGPGCSELLAGWLTEALIRSISASTAVTGFFRLETHFSVLPFLFSRPDFRGNFFWVQIYYCRMTLASIRLFPIIH